ncbi:hypothetical protein GGH96_003803 [Coemansia sp. RSA 1972]|nr:hypothetical protein GGH96_003803 [Coemansia sp. RSA 1972]
MSTPKGYYYAVRVGRTPGIYRTWDDCKAMTHGFQGAIFKKFRMLEEANTFMGEEAAPDQARIEPCTLPAVVKKEAAPVKASAESCTLPAVVNEETTSVKVCTEPSTQPAEVDGPTIYADGAPLAGETHDTITVYTDGASSRNGQEGAVAGIGVYFGPDDARNISEPLIGGRQTNQRAELMAIRRAIESVPKSRKTLYICTDSKYSIKCLSYWYKKWVKNNWVGSTGASVENRDIIEPTLELIRARRGRVRFIHVRGHAGIPGNEAADKLAVAGAFKYLYL